MTLTTFSNRNRKEFKETYSWAMKKSRGMLALLALLMFIAFPMILMIGMANAQHNTDTVMTVAKWAEAYSGYVFILSVLATLLVLLFVLVTAVQQFSYLHQKRSVDLFHSLPVGRVPLLLGRYCAALTTLFVPILFNFAVVSIVGFSYGIAAQFSFTAVAVQMLWIMLMITAALTFSVFMAICTGTSFDMVISILGINVAYPLLVYVSGAFASNLLPGLRIELNLQSTVLTALSPFAAAFFPLIGSDRNPGIPYTNGTFLGWWIALTLILLAASIMLYKKRKSECAESSFAFPIPKIVIRLIITAVAGIGFGMVLQSVTSVPWNFFLGLITGSLAAHIVVEAVYSRGFQQMKRSFAWYGIFAAAFLVLYGVLATGFFGFDTRLPSADQVESISISASNNSRESTIYDDEHNRIIGKITPTLKDQTNIVKVLELHKSLVNDNRKKSFPYAMNGNDYSSFTLTYHLKNGGVVKRSYPYSDYRTNEPKSNIKEMAAQITQMKEYRETASILFYLEPEYVKSIDLYFNTDQSKQRAIMPDTNAKAELLEALKQDYLDGEVDDDSDRVEGNSMSVITDYEYPIALKDGKLKTFLGGYTGNIYISGNNGIQISDGAKRTKAVIEKFGWEK
jgi:ABC-2 type transport system permease protein